MLATASPSPRRPRIALVAGGLVGVAAVLAAGFFWHRSGVAELPGGSSAGELAPPVAANSTDAGSPSPLGDASPALSSSPPHATTTGAAAPPVPAASPPAAAPTPNTAPLTLHFDTLADTLEQAVRNFRDRNADFALDRLTCDGLAVGYHSADAAFIALASAHRTARDALDSAREARYQRLAEQMRGVNEMFDSSKCPRP
jgi:hypothetical protein